MALSPRLQKNISGCAPDLLPKEFEDSASILKKQISITLSGAFQYRLYHVAFICIASLPPRQFS
jgi:hypothetical protein